MMSAENQLTELQDLAHKLRIHSVKMTQASNSGHPTSCSSMAEIMSVSVTYYIICCLKLNIAINSENENFQVLFYRVVRYSVSEPKHPSNDR